MWKAPDKVWELQICLWPSSARAQGPFGWHSYRMLSHQLEFKTAVGISLNLCVYGSHVGSAGLQTGAVSAWLWSSCKHIRCLFQGVANVAHSIWYCLSWSMHCAEEAWNCSVWYLLSHDLLTYDVNWVIWISKKEKILRVVWRKFPSLHGILIPE